MKIKSFLILLSFIFVYALEAQQLAFPGAEGYGKYATGGRGGQVIKVTNLDDLNRAGGTVEGSLRAALNTPGDDPITIVFDTSGVIELAADLKVKRSNVTIAGQTAPGDGICIKGYTVNLGGSKNVIIRYIRFRPGDVGHAEVSALRFENSENIIIDHCSMSWAVEEIMGFYDNKYTTVQWCILSEGLYESLHKKGARGYAAQWGGQYASYHHNFIAHNNSRSPRINGSQSNDTIALLDIRNNVIFNWGSTGAIYGGEEAIAEGKCETNMVNNYYIPGAATSSTLLFARPSYKRTDVPATGYAGWYFSGNYMEGVTGGMNDDNWLGVEIIAEIGSADNIKSETEFEVSPITTHTAFEAKDTVLAGAGAILPKRDAIDVRLVKEAKGEINVIGNGRIDSQSEVGGWVEMNSLYALVDTDGDGMPDDYETENGLNPELESDGALEATNGYTNLENYINGLSGLHGLEEDPNAVDTTEVLGNKALNGDFVIYPNPSSNLVYINSQIEIKEVQVFDMGGRKLDGILWNHDTYTLDVSGVKSGLYLVKAFLTDGSVLSQRLIKQ